MSEDSNKKFRFRLRNRKIQGNKTCYIQLDPALFPDFLSKDKLYKITFELEEETYD